jgi:type II secretory pathway component PulF
MKLYHARFAQARPGGVNVLEEDFYLPDEHAVRRQLRNKGLWPITIREQKPPLFEWMDIRSRAWQLQLLRALRFQSATASTGTALLNIIEGEQDPRRRLAFLPTRTVLKGGGSFSEALRQLRLMDAATMAIIKAGERAGDLKGVIQHAIEHTEQKGKQYKAIVATLSIFSFDIVNVYSVVWAAQVAGIPYLKNNGSHSKDPAAVEKFNHALDIASDINMTILIFLNILIGVALTLGATYWFNRHKPTHFAAQLMMKIPVFADYMRCSSLKDNFKLMTRLLRGKVPLAEAVDIIIDSTSEPSSRLYWMDAKSRIMAGVEPSRALRRWPLTKGEWDQLATIQSVDQLAEVFDALSEERDDMAKAYRRKLMVGCVMLAVVVVGAVILNAIFLLWIQNEGTLNDIKSVGSG